MRLKQRLGEAALCLGSTHAEPQLHMGLWAASIQLRAMLHVCSMKFEQTSPAISRVPGLRETKERCLKVAETSQGPHWSETSPQALYGGAMESFLERVNET